MHKIINTLLILICITMDINAFSGKIMLQNGHSIKGDIRKADGGGYWVTSKSGSMRFEQDEVKSVIVYSTKDSLSDKFVSSMKITPGLASQYGKPQATGYENIISKEAEKNDIDPALVKAVIKAESNYNINEVSCKGACGLMQLMPETARLLGVKSIFSPEQNIEAGTRFLRYMIDTFNGNIEMAVAAYNAGPSAVKRYGSIPPFKETRDYVKNVLRNYRPSYGNGSIRSYTDKSGNLNMYNNK